MKLILLKIYTNCKLLEFIWITFYDFENFSLFYRIKNQSSSMYFFYFVVELTTVFCDFSVVIVEGTAFLSLRYFLMT